MRFAAFALMLTLPALAACTVAGAVPEGTQTIRIAARPAETVCDIERDGEIVAQATREREITVESGTRRLTFHCRAPGHTPMELSVAPVVRSVGLTGVLASGAERIGYGREFYARYPDLVRVELTPGRS